MYGGLLPVGVLVLLRRGRLEMNPVLSNQIIMSISIQINMEFHIYNLLK